MQSTAIPVSIGGAELLVEVEVGPPMVGTQLTGTQFTARVDDAAGRVVDTFGRVKDAIVQVAASTVEVVQRTSEQAVRPDHLQVQFGLKIGASGNVIVAGVSGEATVNVTLVYDIQHAPVPAESPKGSSNGAATSGTMSGAST